MHSEARADILLVDDSPANLLALESVLESIGENLVKVSSGRDALRYLFDHDVALILMDVQMPDMGGYETAALIQARPRSRHTPIIFLTAYDRTDAQMFEGYAVGAVDFLTKPFVPEVLRSKVAAFVELFRKTEEVKRQGERLREAERKEYERELAEAEKRLEAEKLQREIELAREIQQGLFPSQTTPLPGFDIGGASYPADATGGDYYDYFPLIDDSLGIVIGDVSGHGIGPALIMAATRAYLHALAMTYHDVGQILKLANTALIEDVRGQHFVTLILASLDPATRTLAYASAGHPSGYVLNANGNVKAVLESTGIPLGIMQGKNPSVQTISLDPGDLVFLFTDGLIEAWSPEKTHFGSERALQVVRAAQDKPAREIVPLLYKEVCRFAEERPQPDDITAIIIKVSPDA
jgi:serine phosphatase RsbU (regulator of sigma subunit)